MKVLSKDVYAILRESIGPEMKTAGFKRVKMGMLCWSRLEDQDGHTTLWFQCDRFGWFKDFGSRFILEFQFGSEASAGCLDFDRRSRFMALLTPEEREMVRGLNNLVVNSLPAPKPTNPIFLLNESQRRSFLSTYETRAEPYAEREDVWMHYFTVQHVEDWASFFKNRILRMATEFSVRMKQVKSK